MNNFSQAFFSKDLDDLTLLDISKYFEVAKEESYKIEFKAYHSQYGNLTKNLEGVIRGICAFLNSEGGMLIWGAPLGENVGNTQVFKGDLSLVEKSLDKDQLISKISDSISPLPIGVNVKILNEGNKFLYIFEIQRSIYSPHQYKNIYWARLDGQTKPAPHYLVEALFKKISYPNIEGYIILDSFGRSSDKINYLDISIMIINFSELQNDYDITYRLISTAVFRDANSTNPNISNYYNMDGHQFNCDYIKTIHYGAPEISSQRLLFNINDLKDGEIILHLVFGGKNSPLKYSEYTLDFRQDKIHDDDLSSLIKAKSENILFSEKQRKLGTTKEKLLKKLLKR